MPPPTIRDAPPGRPNARRCASADTAWRAADVAARWRAAVPLPRRRRHVSSRAPCSTPTDPPGCLDRVETVTQSQPRADRSRRSPRATLVEVRHWTPWTGPKHDQRVILVRRPSPHLAEGEVTHIARRLDRGREGVRPMDRLRPGLRSPRMVGGRTRPARRSPRRRVRRGRARDVRPAGGDHPARHDVTARRDRRARRAPRRAGLRRRSGSTPPAPSTAATCSRSARRSTSGSAGGPT